jgi:hypothetical protein
MSFRERLRGPIALGATCPQVALQRPSEQTATLVADLLVTLVDDVHSARATGTVSLTGVADHAAVDDGRVDLYVPDAETGMKRVRYTLRFTADDGRRHELIATTYVRPGRARSAERRTAYARLVTIDDGTVVGAGVLRMGMLDAGRRWWSLARDGDSWLAAARAYRDLTRAELRTRLVAVPS